MDFNYDDFVAISFGVLGGLSNNEIIAKFKKEEFNYFDKQEAVNFIEKIRGGV